MSLLLAKAIKLCGWVGNKGIGVGWLYIVGSLMECDNSRISRDEKCPIPSAAGYGEAVSICFYYGYLPLTRVCQKGYMGLYLKYLRYVY